MPITDTHFTTAEAVSIALGADLSLIAPDGQSLAAGSDGVITALAPWVLSSATVNFEAQGVTEGDLVLLSPPDDAGSDFRDRFGEDEPFVVATVDGQDVTLRGQGMPAGLGQGPGTLGDLAGVWFRVPYLLPQIEDHSDAVRDDLARDGTTDYADDRFLGRMAVAHLAWFTYQQAARESNTGDDLSAKAKLWHDYYNSLRSTLQGLGPDEGDGGGGESEPSRTLSSGSLQVMKSSGSRLNTGF